MLPEVWKVPSNRRILIKLNYLGQPVGENSKKLTNFIGVVMRNHCPMHYESWLHISEERKENLKKFITRKFTCPPEIDDWLNATLPGRFRYHKWELKKDYFHPLRSLEYNLANRPPGMDREDWKCLVDIWRSKRGKEISKKNRASRLSQNPTHTTGSMSYARKEELLDTEAGEKVGRIETWQVSHLRKDGTYIDPKIQEILEKANARKQEMTQASPSMSPTEKCVEELRILSEVLGKKRGGRIRGAGAGPTETKLFKKFRISTPKNHTDEEVVNLGRDMAAQRLEFEQKIQDIEDQRKREKEEQDALIRMLMQQVQSLQQTRGTINNLILLVLGLAMILLLDEDELKIQC